jgi:hypothetical protein
VERRDEDDGGATELLELVLDGTPTSYRSFASDYFEHDPGEGIDIFYELQPADAAAVRRLNPNTDPTAVLNELESMGYTVRRA